MKEEDQLSVEMVLAATKGVLMQGDAETSFTGVSTDSRSIKPGELFFALRGENFDGHRFFAEAIQRGGRGRWWTTSSIRLRTRPSLSSG